MRSTKAIAPIVFCALFGAVLGVGTVQAQSVSGALPRVIATNPANGKTCIKLNTKVVAAVFSDRLDPYSISTGSVTLVGPNNTRITDHPDYKDASSFKRDLYPGTKGADVSELQQNLIDGGFLDLLKPTGTYDAKTVAAVKAWQRLSGISATGNFGPVSRSRFSILIFTPSVTLTPDARYSAAVASGIRSAEGRLLIKPIGWFFTAGPTCGTTTTTGTPSGVQGIQGTPGAQGTAGTQGTAGAQGTAGTQGVQGIQGIQGIQGATGTQGERGYLGLPGASGTLNVSLGMVPHAMLSDSTSQPVPQVTDALPITFNTNDDMDLMNHSTTVDPSRIYITDTGDYLFIVSALFAPNGNVNIWVRKNGVNIPGSNSVFSANGYIIETVPFAYDLVAGDYIEFIQSVTYPGDGIIALPASANPDIPATPSIILTAMKISD